MKFQAVYQQKCIKLRKEAEVKKRKEENRAKRAAQEAKLEAFFKSLILAFRSSEEKLESDIFGSNDGILNNLQLCN